jgi:predicted AAA+ superfamily ATPase
VEIISSKGQKEYDDWVVGNEATIKKYELSREGIKNKLSMSLICDMAANSAEGKLSYKAISSSLHVNLIVLLLDS